jgi:Ig-like domain-containing protein
VNRWGKASFAILLALSAAACSAVVSHVSGNGPGAPIAPSITTQPVNQTVTAGQSATFTVAASGTAPLSYQWQKNGANIAGATSASYTTRATASSDSGSTFDVVVSNTAGTATSSPATLTVSAAPVAPSITTQPVNQSVSAGQSATFSVVASSTAPLSYQWQKNGANIVGATSASYTTPATASSDSGSMFDVVVSNSFGTATSSSATLTVTVAATAPTITTQPLSQSVTAGQTATFSVTASGTAPLSYQWKKNGTALTGATSSSYTTPATASSDNGAQFTVIVSNTSGSATSNAATLTVNNGSTATDCTLFASPSGNDGNSGASASAPKTFNGAASASQPGSVVCLLAGTYNMGSTFYPPTSGTPSSWIIYKSYGNGAVNLVWTAGATGQPMFKFGSGSFPSGAAYLEFRGLNLDGQNNALDGFLCQGGHHLRFMSNSISNTGGSGVGAVDCDYLTSDHNLINHNGYLYGWTSAISYNSAQWFDNYPGFHNIASNNIITGEYDGSPNHTDGNGIILDLSNGSYNFSSANTPPALIINNVVYGNGGRCIQANVVTNFYIINNTCYKNDLDTSLGNVGSFTSQNSMNGYFINNIAVAVASNNPSYDQESSNSNIQYFADMYFGSSNNFSYANPSQLINANPLFVNAPSLGIGGYTSALAPSLLGAGLTLQASSPAYNRGIDPSTLSGLSSSIVSDLKKYIYVDITGKARPQGGGVDLGAYQH